VIESDANRSGTYDFLSQTHGNYGPSRTVSEINGDFGRKRKFILYHVFNVAFECVTIRFCNGIWSKKKTRMRALL